MVESCVAARESVIGNAMKGLFGQSVAAPRESRRTFRCATPPRHSGCRWKSCRKRNRGGGPLFATAHIFEVILYRPTGPRELELVAESGWTAWPPRLPDQPIFYPILTFEYAEKIARDWNSTREDTGFRGYVTRFEIDAACATRYPVQFAGGKDHQELWVPAEELDEFNRHIVGKIEVVAEYAKGERVDREA